MSGKNPLNYSTEVDAAKTAGECVAMLARHGAKKVGMEYESGEPVGLSFQAETAWGLESFSLPVNFDGTQRLLNKAYQERRITATHTRPDQVHRVAWRVIKDWLEAQLALIEAGAIDLPQAMFAYMNVDGGMTLYGAYAKRQLELTAGSRS